MENNAREHPAGPVTPRGIGDNGDKLQLASSARLALRNPVQNPNPFTLKLQDLASRTPQFKNRQSRTLLTSPSIINIDNVFEPPALIRGSGMPTTGIRPMTIPTFTKM